MKKQILFRAIGDGYVPSAPVDNPGTGVEPDPVIPTLRSMDTNTLLAIDGIRGVTKPDTGSIVPVASAAISEENLDRVLLDRDDAPHGPLGVKQKLDAGSGSGSGSGSGGGSGTGGNGNGKYVILGGDEPQSVIERWEVEGKEIKNTWTILGVRMKKIYWVLLGIGLVAASALTIKYMKK